MINPVKVTLFSFLLICLCCKSEYASEKSSNENSKEGYSARIIEPAGEMLEGYKSMLVPTFFNIASLEESDSLQAIVLGSRLKSGKNVMVDPVAFFGFQKKNKEASYLVCVPSNMKLQSEVNDYQTFMSLNHELTTSIESWFKAQCGIGNCSDYTWENPHKVLIKLDTKNNPQQ